MPHQIEDKLVIAVASSALFDLKESDDVYRQNGVEAYRKYQRDKQSEPLSTGIAFPFIRRFLSLNKLDPANPPVEVVLLSKNDPDTGNRVYKSAAHHGLDVTRGAFLSGKDPHEYMGAFNACLFLSANRESVASVMSAGHPAGLVLGDTFADDTDDTELRVAFDFDGVLADDEAEAVYHTTKNLNAFHAAEAAKVASAHTPGPLQKLFRGLADLQHRLKANVSKVDDFAVRIAIITARNAPSHERLVTTLREWNVQPDETFLLGGIEKQRILRVFRPHMFFDDQLIHLESSTSHGAMVHVPFGIKNKTE